MNAGAVEYDSKRVVHLIESLDEDECRLVFAMMIRQIPGTGTVSNQALTKDRHWIFENLISGNTAKKRLEKLGDTVTRGIGAVILHPDTGQQVEVTQETWRLGPRGQWYDIWEQVMTRLQKKFTEY